jgi:hypothetical protein
MCAIIIAHNVDNMASLPTKLVDNLLKYIDL